MVVNPGVVTALESHMEDVSVLNPAGLLTESTRFLDTQIKPDMVPNLPERTLGTLRCWRETEPGYAFRSLRKGEIRTIISLATWVVSSVG